MASHTCLAILGLTVATRLMVRDTVAMDTFANCATVRISILPGLPAAGGLPFLPVRFTMESLALEYGFSIPQQIKMHSRFLSPLPDAF